MRNPRQVRISSRLTLGLPPGRQQFSQPSVVCLPLFDAISYSEPNNLTERWVASLQQRKSFEIRAEWDGEAGVWWCSNEELPLTTEAPTFEQLVSRVLEIAPEIAAENGLAAPGDEIEVHVIAERVQSVPVVAAV
jgi:hypothetical protein